MDSDSSLAILILVVSLLVFAGVTVCQAAFLYLGHRGSASWLEGEAAARAVRRMLSRSGRIAALFALLRMACVLVAGLSVAAWVVASAGASWGLGVILAVAALLLLIVIHSIARALGRRHYRAVLLATSPVVVGGEWILMPLLRAVERLSVAVGQWGWDGAPAATDEQAGARDEGRSELSVEEEVREADPEERRMIRGILRLEDVAAREIMVPRVDIIAAEMNTPLTDVGALMADGGHSRIPVYKETIDNVIGIVHARDVLQSVTSPTECVGLIDIARPALFIPDSKPLDQLLREFQERRVTIAVVVDEYGGTEGLITIEDLLEEIVGEIEDEFGREEPPIVQLSENETIVDGRVTLDELNELFRTRLEGDGFDTVGGLISTHLGKIPVAGDSVSLEGLTIRVLSTSGRRVRKVSVVQQA